MDDITQLISGSESIGNLVRSSHANGGYLIAEFYPSAFGGFEGAERAARLFKAAPELLEVAQNILSEDLLPYLPAEYVAKVRAAIAKAIGEPQ